MTKKPYEERTDLEKIQSQWYKLSGLHSREEWSVAIVRATTAAEIAANFAVRAEFSAKSQVAPRFVDSILLWHNGLAGKLDRILIPISEPEPEKNRGLRALKTLAAQINRKRNSIAHQGEFCNEDEAKEIIDATEKFIISLMLIYDPKFILKKRGR